mmetsp:Transcript_85548/g.164698  ORF Transcript_85548/g.164698 Transcript_85548/m.164698 type:complete len:212 (+) Transcript_85548:2150-2785(+)
MAAAQVANTVLRSMTTAMPMVKTVASVRKSCALRTNLRCRRHAFITSDLKTTVVFISLEAYRLRLIACTAWDMIRSGVLCRGSITQTASLKDGGRRFTKSNSPTMSLSVIFSLSSMPLLSNWSSTCFMMLLGSMASSSSDTDGLGPKRTSSAMKGLQLASGVRLKTFWMMFTNKLICFGTLGVLSTMIMGLDWRMVCIILFFIFSLPPMNM